MAGHDGPSYCAALNLPMLERKNARATLAAACLGNMVSQIDVSVVNVGLGDIGSAFHADLNGLQWVINSYALALSALLIPSGSWGDRFGPRPVFALGFLIFTIASVGCGIAASMPVLLEMRTLQGIGAALLLPSSLTCVRLAYSDPRERQTAIAIWGGCGGLGMAVGPALGGLLIEYLGWRSVFLLNVPIGLATLVLILRHAPTSRRIEGRSDVAGQILIAMCVAALTFGLTEIGSPSGAIFGQLSLWVSGLALALFIVAQRRSAYPMILGRLVRNGMFLNMLTAGMAINFTFFGALFVLSIFFQKMLHMDAQQIGFAFVPLTAVLAVSSIFSSQLVRLVSPNFIFNLGFGVEAAAFFVLFVLGADTSLFIIKSLLMLVGFGSALAAPAVMGTMLSSVEQRDAGISSGLMASARQTGGAIGVAIFGMMINYPDPASFAGGMEATFLVSSLALLFCLSINALLPRPLRSPPA